MSLINPLILAGLGLALIPVILHLLMRAKPKKLLFPALRLLEARRKTNTRRIKLRHWWLLILRMAVVGLLVFAIARPSLPAANYGLTVGEWLRLGGIVVVALAVYFGLEIWWSRQRLPNHIFAYRRSMLRGGVGVGVLALLLLLIVWPYQRRIAGEYTSPMQAGAENLPVAAVLLFDTSLSMDYRLENKSRLELSREYANESLDAFPPNSRVAVADTGGDSPILFQTDLTAARDRLNDLATRPATIPLNDRLRAAVQMLEDDFERTMGQQSSVPEDLRRDQYLREVYVYTDLHASAWRMGAGPLAEDLKRLTWIKVYFIDVGVDQPLNVGVTTIRLAKQSVSDSIGATALEATIESVGMQDREALVEVSLHSPEGGVVKLGERPVKLTGGSGVNVAFPLSGLKGPIARGEVRVVGSDPLAFDDVRHFSVNVRPAPRVLVVSDTRDDAVYWLSALAPPASVRQGKARYRCDFLDASRLEAAVNLGQYDVICLLNVSQPTNASWRKLADYVSAGGGLFLALGSANIDPLSYGDDEALAVLPAELLGHVRFDPPATLDLGDLSHPLFAEFERLGGVGDLSTATISRAWSVQAINEGRTLVRFTDPRELPALLERGAGRGRTVMLTTGVDLAGFSALPRAQWFVVLADQLMQYLGQGAAGAFNYNIGDVVEVRLDREQPLNQYLLRKPGFQQIPGDVAPGSSIVTLEAADQIGHYEVVDGEAKSTFSTGFSVNARPEEGRFTILQKAELDELLGPERYAIARNPAELVRIVERGRIGQEMFPFVMLFVVIAFVGELLVSNRFYDEEQRDGGPAAERAGAQPLQ